MGGTVPPRGETTALPHLSPLATLFCRTGLWITSVLCTKRPRQRIGGMGSILGSVLGAITLAVLPELFAKLPGE